MQLDLTRIETELLLGLIRGGLREHNMNVKFPELLIIYDKVNEQFTKQLPEVK